MRYFVATLPVLAALALSSCQQPPLVPAKDSVAHVVQTQHGMASIYKDRRTASGERFHSGAMAAAHKSWPMGTRVRVTHLSTGRQATVRINDRGPYIRGRVIDLTPAAASAIGLTARQGIARVKIERLY